MAVKGNNKSKVVFKNVQDTNLDVRITFVHVGEGRTRRVESSTYGIFSTKHKVKDGFNKPELAIDFLMENYHKYDKKIKKFK